MLKDLLGWVTFSQAWGTTLGGVTGGVFDQMLTGGVFRGLPAVTPHGLKVKKHMTFYLPGKNSTLRLTPRSTEVGVLELPI